MIKGRYAALVEIDIHIDEEKNCIRSFEDIKDDIVNGYLTKMLTELIRNDFGGEFADVKVTQQQSDLYRVEDGEADE